MVFRIQKRIRLPLLACIAIIFFSFIVLPSGSARADYAAAVKAYNSKDYATALREFRREAERGDPYAQQALGLMYEKGRGVEVNFKTAAHWYQLAADQGEPLAAVNLGILYRDGQGVGQDFTKARHYLTIGAMQNDGVGQNALGALCANGKGVARNDVEAYAWFLLASDNGADAKVVHQNLKLLKGRMSVNQLDTAEDRRDEIEDRIADGERDPGVVAENEEQDESGRKSLKSS